MIIVVDHRGRLIQGENVSYDTQRERENKGGGNTYIFLKQCKSSELNPAYFSVGSSLGLPTLTRHTDIYKKK